MATIISSVLINNMQVLHSSITNDGRNVVYIEFKIQSLPIAIHQEHGSYNIIFFDIEHDLTCTPVPLHMLDIWSLHPHCEHVIQGLLNKFVSEGLIHPNFSADSIVEQVLDFVNTAASVAMDERHDKVMIQVVVQNTTMVDYIPDNITPSVLDDIAQSLCPTCNAIIMDALKTKKFDDRDFLQLKNKEDDVCSICLEKFSIGVYISRTPCSHVFHTKCVVPWLKIEHTCPLCRDQVFTL